MVAFPISETENVYLRDFTTHSFFLGITDKAEEGKFLTDTKEPLAFTKWNKGETNNYGRGEDCTEMKREGVWNYVPCSRLRFFICQTPSTPLRDCLDFSDKCVEHFTSNPGMCNDFPTFAESHFRFTCGFYDLEKTPTCQVEAQGTESENLTELTRGMTLTFSCDEGYVPLSGDAVRGCLADGRLSGTSLECIEDCPPEWTINLETLHCYKMFHTPKNYSAAEGDCVKSSGHLTTASDDDEQAFVTSLKGDSERIWLGLSDSMVEGKFRWASGAILLYSNWNKGEPNDYGRDGEDCTQMFKDGKWNDVHCNNVDLKFICKIPRKGI